MDGLHAAGCSDWPLSQSLCVRPIIIVLVGAATSWRPISLNFAALQKMAMAAQRSAFTGAFKAGPTRVSSVRRTAKVTVEAKKVCDLLGTQRNKANQVCFSNKKVSLVTVQCAGSQSGERVLEPGI